jgi:hypothetical protein
MWPEHVQVQAGDTVTINHAGFEDVTHKQFDSNGKEPFKARSHSPIPLFPDRQQALTRKRRTAPTSCSPLSACPRFPSACERICWTDCRC